MKNRLVGSLYVNNSNPMKQQMIESALMIDKWVSGKKEEPRSLGVVLAECFDLFIEIEKSLDKTEKKV